MNDSDAPYPMEGYAPATTPQRQRSSAHIDDAGGVEGETYYHYKAPRRGQLATPLLGRGEPLGHACLCRAGAYVIAVLPHSQRTIAKHSSLK